MLERVLACVVAVPFVLGMAAAPSDRGEVEFAFRDHEIVESSGLVVTDGLFITTNDSGDTGRVFAVDPATGSTVGVTQWSDDPIDVEALAPGGNGQVWVGDLGDNTGSRDGVVVTKVTVGETIQEGPPQMSFELVYPDGAHDAETLLADPNSGRLFVVTKGVFGGTIYAAPKRLDVSGRNRLVAIGDALPIATDGSFFPDGKHFIVRDYTRAAVYSFPDLAEVGSFRLPAQQQGEGIAVDADGAVFVSSEGQFSEVVRVSLPADIERALAPVPPTTSPSAGESPSTEFPRVEDFPEPANDERPLWPWFLTGLIGAAAIVVLLRSLRRR